MKPEDAGKYLTKVKGWNPRGIIESCEERTTTSLKEEKKSKEGPLPGIHLFLEAHDTLFGKN